MDYPKPPLTVAGLFAGIGGIELGLAASGHHAQMVCEIEPTAAAILREHFPDATLTSDVRAIDSLPNVDLVTAGFPCQDLSQAGKTAGISGQRSGLVGEVFRLMQSSSARFLLLENVPFMLQLDQGQAMSYLTSELSKMGFNWAYRVVDTRSFGLPQRRQRVLLLASRTDDPRPILLGCNENPVFRPTAESYGFYWTEGLKGLGWGVDCVPTLKGGSTIGIPSPPAIWRPATGEVGTPSLRDCERLQGFPCDWTAPALKVKGARDGARWKCVGNAVSVPLAKWVGERLRMTGSYDSSRDEPHTSGSRWPTAAWGQGNDVRRANVTPFPAWAGQPTLSSFLLDPLKPLSQKALSGFLSRAERGSLRFKEGFLDNIRSSISGVQLPLAFEVESLTRAA
ncbi:MAG: DNA (cytosine-5-)-methyltransferase [Myxococcales bacterium]|nr:DNA (cytosine-5-)-methyltransferase [Myxococcales bacterium]